MSFNPNTSKQAHEVIFLFLKIKKPNHPDLIFNNNIRYVFTTPPYVFR